MLLSTSMAAPPTIPVPGATGRPAGTPPFIPAPARQGLEINGMRLPLYFSQPVARRHDFHGDGSIRGRVIDKDHDKPVPDATVVLLSLSEGQMPMRRLEPRESLETDGNGEFAFLNVPAGEYLLQAYHSAATLVPWVEGELADGLFRVQEGEEVNDRNLLLYGGHRVTVRLNNLNLPEGGTSGPVIRGGRRGMNMVIGQQMSLARDRLIISQGYYQSGAPRLNGNEVEFQNVFGGRVRMEFEFEQQWVRGAGGQRLDFIELELNPDEYEVSVEMELEDSPVLEGRVLRADRSAAGPGEVTWRSARTSLLMRLPAEHPKSIVSEDGTFTIEIPGRSDGFLVFELGDELPIQYGRVSFRESFPDLLEIVLPEPGILNVLVTTNEDEPVPGATVAVWTSRFDSIRLRQDAESQAQVVFLPKQSPDEDGEESEVHMGPEPTVRFEAETGEDGIARFTRLSSMRFEVQAHGPTGSRLAPNAPVTTAMEFGVERELRIKLEGFKPFAGVVLDPEGIPISDAIVQITPPVYTEEQIRSTRTDAEGRFRFDAVGENELSNVQVFTPAQPDARHMMGRQTPGEENAVLQLRAPRSASRMRINIVDGVTGEPIDEPTVTNWEGEPLPDSTSTERGIVEVPRTFMADGPIGYLVSADGYGRVPIIFPHHIGRSSEVQLFPSATIRGRVIDEKTGEGIAGALVEHPLSLVMGVQEPPLESPFRTHTDDRGIFVLEDLSIPLRNPDRSIPTAGGHHLVIRHEGEVYAPSYRMIELNSHGEKDFGDIELGKGFEVDVQVMREGMGLAGEAVSVEVTPHVLALTGMGRYELESRTGDDGRVVFERLPTSRVSVRLPRNGFSRSVMLHEWRRPIAFELGSGVVELAVINEGDLRNLTVSGNGPNWLFLKGETTASGPGTASRERAVLEDLSFGPWRLNVSQVMGRDRVRARIDLELSAEEPRLELALPFGLNTVKALMKFEDEARPSRLQVTLEPIQQPDASMRVRYQATASTEGVATFHQIPGGEYSVVAHNYPSFMTWGRGRVLVGGNSQEHEVVVEFPAEGEDVTVRAVCSVTGESIDDFSVRAAFAHENWTVAEANSDGQREVWLTGLLPERINFTAEAAYRVASSAVLDLSQDGPRTLELRLEPGGTLHVDVQPGDEPPDCPPTGWDTTKGIEVAPADPSNEEAVFRVPQRNQPLRMPDFNLTAGTYQVRALDEGRVRDEREVTVRTGETTTISLRWNEGKLEFLPSSE